MTVLSEQETGQVNDLASRLRRIQMDAATAPSEKRRDLLQEELARSLKGVPQGSRKGYLKVLLARFPVVGQIVQPASAVPDAPAALPPPTLEELLERFLEATTGIPDAKRDEISRLLSKAGFTWVDHAALELEVDAELREKFGLAAGQQPILRRIVELAAQLAEMCARLDQATFNTWNALSRNNPVARRVKIFEQWWHFTFPGKARRLSRGWRQFPRWLEGCRWPC